MSQTLAEKLQVLEASASAGDSNAVITLSVMQGRAVAQLLEACRDLVEAPGGSLSRAEAFERIRAAVKAART